jgi:hypothetical protein
LFLNYRWADAAQSASTLIGGVRGSAGSSATPMTGTMPRGRSVHPHHYTIIIICEPAPSS